MFTGLIQDLGQIESLQVAPEGGHLRVRTRLAAELKPGDSIAVDGICLTATETDSEGFTAEVMGQTLAFTSIESNGPGAPVNLELAAKVGDRLGGHILQGHIDGVAAVDAVTEDGIARRLRVAIPPQFSPYVIPQGSVGLNGVSLTITDVSGPDPAVMSPWLEVSLIPETLERTNLGTAKVDTVLNLECDVIARYVDRLIDTRYRKQADDDEEDPKDGNRTDD